MINLKLTVLYTNGTKAEVKSSPSTEVAFERHFNRGLVEAFQNQEKLRLEWLYFLAHHASKTVTPFDAWLEGVDTIEVEGTDTPDPSAATASTTPSPLSPIT